MGREALAVKWWELGRGESHEESHWIGGAGRNVPLHQLCWPSPCAAPRPGLLAVSPLFPDPTSSKPTPLSFPPQTCSGCPVFYSRVLMKGGARAHTLGGGMCER